MSNKYTWVFFNLVSAIGLLVYVLYTIESVDDSIYEEVSLFLFAMTVSSSYWIYRTIKTWQLCIRADDPNFDKALSEQEAKE